MNRLKRPVIRMLAAATVAAAGFAATPPASAMSATCAIRWTLWEVYAATAEGFYAIGNNNLGNYWYDRAWGVIVGC